ncbi:MAG TPA: GNAT family N-acetyltransferase [Vicinamibacterales bacterium]|nr:GNAT family N-acetyltransferase [Vicinamibacterales bacterium]
MLELLRPDSPLMWDAARRLVEEYAASLNVDLGFQDFPRELGNLSAAYGPPDGHFLLARWDEAFAGCGAVRRFSGTACEMKRLFVAPAHRGRGIGEAIARALIEHARQAGYVTILLDTLPSMTAAHQLYSSLGFTPAPPYRHNPVRGTRFLALQLSVTRGPAACSRE